MSWVILDRDGVINHDSPDYIKSPEEWMPIEGSLEAIALMNQKGYKVAVATNQSGLARGFYTQDTLTNIHNKMHQLLKELGAKVEAIVYCPHGPNDNCDCRKPKPGLLHQLKDNFGIDLSQTPFVGDSWRDIQAGMEAGCQPILVETGNGIKTIEKHKPSEEFKAITVYANLTEVAQDLKALSTFKA